MTNPMSGHTAGTGFSADAQGLKDGNSIISSTSGFVEEGPTGTSYVKVSGGFCKLDGTLYKFAGGNGSSVEVRIGTDTNFSGSLPSPPSSVSDVFVVIYL